MAMRGAIARRAEAVARRVVGLAPFPQPPLAPTRYPVVLMHGLGTLANLAPGGMLHGEAMHLRAHGVWAYAPHVNPYDTVAVRAEAWAERIARVLEETGAEKVNLVGFSLAGLDARHLAGPFGLADRIASIVTVSTPHRGTAIARYLLERPRRLRGLAVAAMEFLGRAAYEVAPPRVRAALEELTPEHVGAAFEPFHPLPERVYCASYAGRAGRGTGVPISPGLVLPNRILYRLGGLNDGLVPVESAHWGRFLGTVDADHARLVGLRLPASAFDSRAFYLGVTRHLRAQGL
jgi:triacylglycerol lipase